LEKHIKLLKSVEIPSAKGDAACAIQLLNQTQSENMHLKDKLSSLLERCAAEANEFQTKHLELQGKLTASQKQAHNLQKRCN
jgi:hypothetical protein